MPTGTHDDDFDDEDNLDATDLVKQLRKQLKEQTRDNAGLKSQLADLAGKDRQRTLVEALATKGLPAKAAKFYPADAELTDEAIASWVGENADIFGVQPTATETTADDSTGSNEDKPGESSVVSPEHEAAWRRMQAVNLAGGAATTQEADALRQIQQAKTPEELSAFLRSRN